MRHDVTHAAHSSKGEFRDGLAGRLGQMRRGFPDDFDAPDHRVLFLFEYTPPLEAGTINWGFQRGRASPLVKGGG